MYCKDFDLSLKPVDQQRRQVAVNLYSKWYFKMSRIFVWAKNVGLVKKIDES